MSAGEPDETPGAGDVTAAELALDLLEGAERAAALRRQLADPAFAADVARWREHFALLGVDAPEQAPPPHLLARIEAALAPANDRGDVRRWQWIAGASSLVAASLLALVVLRPAPVSPPSPVAVTAPVLVAALTQEEGQAVPAVFDPATRRLRIAEGGFVGRGRSAELWVIAADKLPVSLGVLAQTRTTEWTIDARDQQRRFVPGAQLVVTAEAQGGSPDGKPHGPAVAAGPLHRI